MQNLQPLITFCKTHAIWIILVCCVVLLIPIAFLTKKYVFVQPETVLPPSETQSLSPSVDPASITTTGASEIQFGGKEARPALGFALLKYLPIQLPTAVVDFDYSQRILTIKYCGDYKKVITDFQGSLQVFNLGDYTVKEDDILFTNTGSCVK